MPEPDDPDRLPEDENRRTLVRHVVDVENRNSELQRDISNLQAQATERNEELDRTRLLAESMAEELRNETLRRTEVEAELQKLTSVPQSLVRVEHAYDDGTADLSNGTRVGVSPQIRPEDIPPGTLVRTNPQTGAIVELAPHDTLSGEERTFAGFINGSSVLVQDAMGHRVVAQLDGKLDRTILEPGVSHVIVQNGMLRSVIPQELLKGTLGTASTFAMAEFPDVTFDDIAGHEQLITEIRDAIMDPYSHPDLYEHYIKHPEFKFLFFGPPGNGKTSIAKAIARLIWEQFKEQISPHAKGNFIAIRGPELSSKWVGETERFLREIFEGAQRLYKVSGAPVVVFFDDCESFLIQRGTSNASTVNMDYVNQFNTLVDGVIEMEGVSVILATNRVDLLDTGVADRMKRKERVPPPTTRTMAEGIMRIHLRDVPVIGEPDPVTLIMDHIFDDSPDNNVIRVVFEDGEATMQLSEFLSGRLLTSIVETAKTNAIQRDKERPKGQPPSGIMLGDLMAAMETELTDNDSLPTTVTNVREWLRQRGDKREPVAVEPFRDIRKTAAFAKTARRVEGLVQ